MDDASRGRTRIDAGDSSAEIVQSRRVTAAPARSVGGLRRGDGAKRRNSGGFVGGDPRTQEARNGDGRDDQNDRDDDQKLDEGKPFLWFFHSDPTGPRCFLSVPAHQKFCRFIGSNSGATPVMAARPIPLILRRLL